MGILEILLIVACAALVIGVITVRIIKKKRGETSCDCGCSGCSCCCGCDKDAKKN
ncbi:MAG: FeoB-associated Cys-rich membrane protein [Clostridia bacterium]|nr:FeoB-associated Cys-rich membrane protein [Clostridia bacterium]